MSHFKIILENCPMICLGNKYPYQNTLEYKMNKRVGFQNNFKMRHESLEFHIILIQKTQQKDIIEEEGVTKKEEC